MATPGTDISEEKDVEKEPLLLETVWLKQPQIEEAEAIFQQLSINDSSGDRMFHNESGDCMTSLDDIKCELPESKEKSNSNDKLYLEQETVWFKQQFYEDAEVRYHMFLAGTFNSDVPNVTIGTPNKRLHVHDGKTQFKKQRQEGKGKGEALERKLHTEVGTLSKTLKTIQGRLEDFEKTQQRKAQAVRDAASRLTAAIEACQSRLNDEINQSAGQFSSLRASLGEVDSIISNTDSILEDEAWGKFKTHDTFCQAMADRIAKLNQDLIQCAEICNCFQADVPKSDINRIVGEIGRLSLIKKQQGPDKFGLKNDLIAKSIKELLNLDQIELESSGSPVFSDSGPEESGCISETSENDTSAGKLSNSKNKTQSSKGRDSKTKKTFPSGKANRNGNAVPYFGNKGPEQNPAAKLKPEVSNDQLNFGQHIAAKKRNAQGTQSTPQKKQDLFKFKGMSHTSKTPFVHQPGLLGPRPNLLQAPGQVPFRFSNLNTMIQQQQRPALTNFGTMRNMNPVSSGQTGFGSMGFNFSNQSRTRPMESIIHNPSVGLTSQNQGHNQMAHNVSGPVRQSKLFQIHQNQSQNKSLKGTEQQFGAQSRQGGFSFPFHQNPIGSGMLQNAQGSLMNAFTGVPQGSMEQQLNEISQKIQHMQLAASQNYQLRQLMQETERLKQMVAQKQHQQQDRFQHQFQLLINAFMQQQQQQLAQGPQSKIAKSMMYQNSQKQRLFQNRQHQLQQQKKQKQQQNKVQHVRQEQQLGDPLKKIKPETCGQHINSNTDVEEQSWHNPFALTSQPPKLPGKYSVITKLSTFDPHALGDKSSAGISSMVVLDNIGCLVVVDIINNCLKLYEVTRTSSSTDALTHNFVTRLELPRPYYMTRLNADTIVISREGKKLSLVRVSKKRLEYLRDIASEAQYYGVAYVKDNVIACAAYTDNKIDLVSIQDNVAHTALLTAQKQGPELVSSLSPTGSVVYLERLPDVAVRLVCISLNAELEFLVDLESGASDVWNFAAIKDKIICCNKKNSKIKLFSSTGALLADLNFPIETVKQPFAMAFCENGNLYIANDGEWDSKNAHYVTTDVNIYEFS
ncbi:unnamed protein product [Lymnaea stagnalis]|uniref:Uncharacterized protein n=1 Tax=Lymnaea stagnalis TaxID=6523 RepID=A0AAV2IGM3_LYMST